MSSLSWAKVYMLALSNAGAQNITFPSCHSTIWPQLLPEIVRFIDGTTNPTKSRSQMGDASLGKNRSSPSRHSEQVRLKKQEKRRQDAVLQNMQYDALNTGQEELRTALRKKAHKRDKHNPYRSNAVGHGPRHHDVQRHE